MLNDTAPLRPDAMKALQQLAAGTPAELVNTRSLYTLERLGLVEWADDHYGREISQKGRALAADMEARKCSE